MKDTTADRRLVDDPPSASDSIELADIREGQMTTRTLSSGRKAILFRHGQEIRVFSEICPHMGADMSHGVVCSDKRTIACQWHGYVFSSDDGSFLDNPNERLTPTLRKPSEHFKPEKTPRYRLKTIPFTIKGSRLFFGREPALTEDA